MKSPSDSGAPGRTDAQPPAVSTVGRKRMGARIRKGIERIMAPSVEEAERRMRRNPGFLASLTPEQLAMIREYKGPEVLGRRDGPRRSFDQEG